MQAEKPFFRVASPAEARDYGFDFRKRCAVGEVLSSVEFTLAVMETEDGATADSSPASRLTGSPDIEASLVSEALHVAVQRITGLVDGNRYRVICDATTDNGQVLQLYADVWSRSPT